MYTVNKMKKISQILLAFAVLFVGVTSCNVAREPKGTPLQKPFSVFGDVEMNRDAVYALLRGVENPNNLNTPDLMSDLYHLDFLDNNSIRGIYNWELQSLIDNDMINGYYASYYSTLMQANYFLFRAQEMLDAGKVKLTDDETKKVKQFIGEMKVVRALAHWRLIQRYSKPWDGTTDNEEQNGIITVMKYDPIAIASAPKSSRAETYKYIMEDLDDAIKLIPEDANKDVKPAIYITQDYAYAMKARAALTMHKWEDAMNAAKVVMDRHPLMQSTGDETVDIVNLEKIWKTEDSPEILVRLNATPQIGAVSTFLFGGAYEKGFVSFDDYTNFEEAYNTYIMPPVVLEQWIVDLYPDGDLRKKVYIGQKGFYRDDYPFKFHALTKFEGNPSLDKDKTRREFKFGVHLFNAAEAYLICAEAAAEAGQKTVALDALGKLEKSRGINFSEDDYVTDDALMKEIRNERVRELVGEGFRMNDIVRWKTGFTRTAPQPVFEQVAKGFGVSEAIYKEGSNLHKDANDPLMIWEFPTRDMENNPNLKAHKNYK